jgi:WD40 repeat protein
MEPKPPFAERFESSIATNRAALEPFEQVLALHKKVKEESALLKEENTFLRGQIESLKTELANASSAAASAIPISSEKAAANAAKLQSKLLELQDQLTETYRTKAAETAKLLSLSEQNQKLKEDNVARQQRMFAVQQDAHAVAEDRDRTRAALKEREAQLSTAAEEVVRLRRLLESKAKECDELRREFASVEAIKSALAAAEAKAETMRKDRDKAVANVQAARQRIDELTRGMNSSNSGASLSPAMPVPALSPSSASGGIVAVGSDGSGGGSLQASTFGGGLPPQTAVSPSSSQAGLLPPPAMVAGASQGSEAQQHGQQQQQQGAAGLLSWLGNRVSAVVSKATGTTTAPTTASPGGAPAATTAPSAAPINPPLTTATGGLGLSLYMSSSVANLASDYIFASLSTPSKALHVIRGAGGSGSSSEVNAVKIHDTGRLVACGSSDGNITLYNITTGVREGIMYTATEGNAVFCVDCAGTVIAGGCSDRTVRIFDLTTQRVVRSLTGHTGKVQALVYIPPTGAAGFAGSGGGGGPTGGFSRGLLFTGAADRMVKLYDLRDGRVCRSIDTKSIVNGIAISPDGQLIAVANQDGTVRSFDLRGGAGLVAENSTCHSSAITSVSYSHHDNGGRLLTASRDNTLRVLDARTLDPLTSFAPPTHDRKPSGDFQQAANPAGSSSRKSVAAGAGGGGSPMLAGLTAASSTDSPTLRPLSSDLSLSGTRTTRASSMSASGPQQLASSTSSLSIVMKGSGFRVPVNFSRAHFSPNGHYAVCGGDRGTIYSWNAETGSLDSEIGLGEGEIMAQQQKRKSSFNTTGSGEISGRTPRAGSFASASAGGGGTDYSSSFGGVGMSGPHEGAAIFGLDYSGYTLVTGDEKGCVVIWGE